MVKVIQVYQLHTQATAVIKFRSNSKVVRPRGRHYEMLSTCYMNARGSEGMLPQENFQNCMSMSLTFETDSYITNFYVKSQLIE